MWPVDCIVSLWISFLTLAPICACLQGKSAGSYVLYRQTMKLQVLVAAQLKGHPAIRTALL